MASEKAFEWLLGSYESTLTWVLDHAPWTLAVLLITIGVNVFLLIVVPKGFFPLQDNGIIQGGIRGEQDISYQAMDQLTKRFVDIIRADPAVANVMAFTGGGSTNTGNIYIGLKPLNQRKLSSSQVIDRLRPKVNAVLGATSGSPSWAGFAHRRQAEQRAVSIHDSERQFARSHQVGSSPARPN